MNADLHCPLCAASGAGVFHRDRRREYLRCSHCALVFVPPAYHLSAAAEKAEYDLHRNAVDDPGYRRFLGRLAEPLMQRVPAPARGMDFGCGPGPALAAMLAEAGYQLMLYDPFYHPDPAALRQHYRFITATEVVEHLQRPGAELQRLWGLLEPGGLLGIMTKLVRDQAAFANWHYKNDATHVCFFSEQTWQWWARQHGAGLERIGADVILLRKPASCVVDG
ncbi:class I SAM-dependent methyltransferase [Haliea sp. E17]|uniref:class I SAM-dependent methyltransferase n=1 Tax=Haliea sp. E17 TaxID=3401576 RepID=UPI003AADC902